MCGIRLHDETIEREYSVPEERPIGNGPYEIHIRCEGCQRYGEQAGEIDLWFEARSNLLERNHSVSDFRINSNKCVAELCIYVKRTRNGVVYIRLHADEMDFVTNTREKAKVTAVTANVLSSDIATGSCNDLDLDSQESLFVSDCITWRFAIKCQQLDIIRQSLHIFFILPSSYLWKQYLTAGIFANMR